MEACETVQSDPHLSKKILPDINVSALESVESAQIAERLFVAIDNNFGRFRVRNDVSLELNFEFDQDALPSWCELKWVGALPSSLGRFFTRIEVKSKKPANLHQAIRVHKENGFVDFFSAPCDVAENLGVHERSWKLSPVDLEDCIGVDLHIFFPLLKNSYEINALSLTAIR